MQWLDNNPELVNMGMSALSAYDEGQRAMAQSPYEVAKTQYGYLTGVGPGKVLSPSKSPAQKLLHGYMSGAKMRADREDKKAIRDLLNKALGSQPAGKPKDIKQDIQVADGGMSTYKTEDRMPIQDVLEGNYGNMSRELTGGDMVSKMSPSQANAIEQYIKRKEQERMSNPMQVETFETVLGDYKPEPSSGLLRGLAGKKDNVSPELDPRDMSSKNNPTKRLLYSRGY